ncbi:MAG: RagB/SusD family nutrient uptake outer membrane protein [Gemmatimonadaceae bacterium]
MTRFPPMLSTVATAARGRSVARRGARRAIGPDRRSRPFALGLLALTALTTVACDIDRLLRIETPSRVAEERLLVPENASLIASSAVADFECALGTYIVASGLAAGEFVEGTQTASRWAYDRRNVLQTDAHYATFDCVNLGVYTPINTARYTNDQAARALSGWTDQQVTNRQRLIATTSALAGYSALLLGEGFCSGAINVGPELTSAQLFDSAEVRLTAAITTAQAANDQAALNLARVGRARARRDKGDVAGAGADAAAVPVDFVYNATASTNAGRRNNRIAAQNGTAVTVAPAYRSMTVAGQPDPRVRATDAGRNSSDQVNRLWVQQKYASVTAPTPIATGIEAQLILAEARGAGEGVLILDQLRARVGLPPLTATEAADFANTLVEERNRWLWLQGNRWYDVRLRNLPLVPAPGTAYSKGGTYGDQRCWPLPDVERLSNPNL